VRSMFAGGQGHGARIESGVPPLLVQAKATSLTHHTADEETAVPSLEELLGQLDEADSGTDSDSRTMAVPSLEDMLHQLDSVESDAGTVQCASPGCNFIVTGRVPDYCCYKCRERPNEHGSMCRRKPYSCNTAAVSEPAGQGVEHAVPSLEELLGQLDSAEASAKVSSGLRARDQRLKDAIRSFDHCQVQALLRDKTDPNSVSACQHGPLVEAVGLGGGGDPDIVCLLLACAADPIVCLSRHSAAQCALPEEEDSLLPALLLCKIFAETKAETPQRLDLLSRLDPGVLAKARWKLRFKGPFALGGASPDACLQGDSMLECEPTAHHRVVLYTADTKRPVLMLMPLREPATVGVLLLHGLFQSGRMLERLARELSTELPHAQLIAPTALTSATDLGVGPSWFPINGVPVLQELMACKAELFRLLSTTGAIPPERLAFVGFSQGGMLAAWLATQLPSPLAGLLLLGTEVVSISAQGAWSLTGIPSAGAQGLSVLHCHGDEDTTISPTMAQASRDFLQDQGCRVSLSFHKGVGHELCPGMIEEAKTWLQEVLPGG